MVSHVLRKLKAAEMRLEALSQEIEELNSEKQDYLREIMKGGQRSAEVKKLDQAIRDKNLVISRAKEEVGNLHAQLEKQLAEFRKELIKEKQRELNQYMEQRAYYLKRIEELQTETSRYRYLLTGEKDHRLANKKSLLPLESDQEKDFTPIDELIGRVKLEVSRVNRMNSKALLEEYLERGQGPDPKP
jgi:chromosome segregation ATPase